MTVCAAEMENKQRFRFLHIFKKEPSNYLNYMVMGRFGPIPVRTQGRFGPIPFRSGRFGLGRFGPILGMGRCGPILVSRFDPLYII